MARAPETVHRARLDPADVQILFADLQGDLVEGSQTRAPAAIGRSAAGLAAIGERLGLPMIFSVAGQDGMDTTPILAIAAHATPERTLARVSPGALADRPTAEALAAAGRPVLLIAGYASEVVVLQSVLDARAAGYEVLYVVDAIGGLSERSEQAMFRAMDQAGAQPTSVISLAARLVPDFANPPGPDILSIIFSLIDTSH